MGKREHPLVWYYDENRNFAELLNGWLFCGKEYFCGEDIGSEDRRILVKSGKQEKNGGKGKGAYRELFRDLYKSVKGMGVRLLVGVEHQSHVHYAMPVRVMDYDHASYARQMKSVSIRHKEEKDLEDEGERLSGFSRTDRLTPVLTLVLYCGSEPWDGARSLHEILDFGNVSEELREYVVDYKIHVLDVCHTSDSRLREFPPDIRTMFLFLKYKDDPEKLRECMQKEEVREDTYDTIAEAVGERRMKKYHPKGEGGKIQMCRAIDLLIADGEKRGEKRGEQRGMERGFKRGEKHGLKCGIEQGMERGFKRGEKHGLKQGTVQGIMAMVSVLRDYDVEDAEIVQKIQEKFEISREEAKKYM